MAISDISVLSVLRNRMQWHQERQRILSENVSNADTPNFRPKELVEPRAQTLASSPASSSSFQGMVKTNPAHITMASSTSSAASTTKNDYETRPAGNAVNLEDEMLKVASNQMDYQAAASLYSRSLGLLKTAIGKR